MKGDQAKHTERVLRYLRERGPLDPLTAWSELGIYRLGARIFDLKEGGHRITRQTKVVKNRFGEECRVAEYHLHPETEPT